MPKEIFVEDGEYNTENEKKELIQNFDGLAKIILKTNIVLLLKDVKFLEILKFTLNKVTIYSPNENQKFLNITAKNIEWFFYEN